MRKRRELESGPSRESQNKPNLGLKSGEECIETNQAENGAIILIGNANVGKSAIFGALTGRYVTVSNYPGTTVEVSSGRASINGSSADVLDTPGTNSLVPLSEDEAVARDILLDQSGYCVIQVSDSKNLRRGLVITVQLAEAGVPFVLCLNMADEAAARGISIDLARLSEKLGVNIIELVAIKGRGIERLRDAIGAARESSVKIDYPRVVEVGIDRLIDLMPKNTSLRPRALALMCLASNQNEDPTLWKKLQSLMPAAQFERLVSERAELGASGYKTSEKTAHRNHEHAPFRYEISSARFAWAEKIASSVIERDAIRSHSVPFAQKLGALSVHPVWGIPILAAVLIVSYQFVGVFGARFLVNAFEHRIFQNRIIPGTEWLVRHIFPANWHHFLVGPLGSSAASQGLIVGQYGLVSMALTYGIAIVLPIVATFFLLFSILEDTGYLPRLAVMLHRGFKLLGLNGKAVLPMVLGLGCDTMATVTTRVLETRKERILVTLLLALGVPCSAQLGVILGMLSALSVAGALWWAGAVSLSIFLAGYVAAKIIPGKGSDFILELPPIRRPLLGNIIVKTAARVEWYLKEALPLFIIGTLALWLMDRYGLIVLLEKGCAPVIEGFLGLPKAATGAFIIGFFRRDYGAAGLFSLFHDAMSGGGAVPRETEIELVVSMVTITLFIPCIANFLMIVKERGVRVGLGIVGFVFPFAIAMGGLVNLAMRRFF